jgi:hypothetical protein
VIFTPKISAFLGNSFKPNPFSMPPYKHETIVKYYKKRFSPLARTPLLGQVYQDFAGDLFSGN